MPDQQVFQGKNALVTGGSHGIGRAISIHLASEGANVAVNYVSRKESNTMTGQLVAVSGRRVSLPGQGIDCAATLPGIIGPPYT